MQYSKALNAHCKTKGMQEITEMTENILKKIVMNFVREPIFITCNISCEITVLVATKSVLLI